MGLLTLVGCQYPCTRAEVPIKPKRVKVTAGPRVGWQQPLGGCFLPPLLSRGGPTLAMAHTDKQTPARAQCVLSYCLSPHLQPHAHQRPAPALKPTAPAALSVQSVGMTCACSGTAQKPRSLLLEDAKTLFESGVRLMGHCTG